MLLSSKCVTMKIIMLRLHASNIRIFTLTHSTKILGVPKTQAPHYISCHCVNNWALHL